MQNVEMAIPVNATNNSILIIYQQTWSDAEWLIVWKLLLQPLLRKTQLIIVKGLNLFLSKVRINNTYIQLFSMYYCIL